jgi:hypothetical protein
MSEVGRPASRPGATELGPAHVVSPNKSGRLAKKADTDEASGLYPLKYVVAFRREH